MKCVERRLAEYREKEGATTYGNNKIPNRNVIYEEKFSDGNSVAVPSANRKFIIMLLKPIQLLSCFHSHCPRSCIVFAVLLWLVFQLCFTYIEDVWYCGLLIEMMEQSNSLLLNEEALNLCADSKKPVFIYEWLRYLDRILPAAEKADIKTVQKKLIEQLTSRILAAPGPPTRELLAKCIAQIYSIGDTYSLFETINTCNDILKGRDDSPTHLPVKLAALRCLGAMYEALGRLVGRSYEESFHCMARWLKSAEVSLVRVVFRKRQVESEAWPVGLVRTGSSQGRAELLYTFAKMVKGLGIGASSIHKDLYKILKTYISDRVIVVRMAAINCLTVLVPEYPFLYTNEMESVGTLCFKALESSNYEVRHAVAQLFAVLLCTAMNPPRQYMSEVELVAFKNWCRRSQWRTKGNTDWSYACLRCAMQRARLIMVRKNLVFVIKHLMDVTAKCGSLAYTNNPIQTAEMIYMRRCIGYILRNTVGTILGEQAQIAVCRQFGTILADSINSFADYNLDVGVEKLLGPEVHASAQTAVIILSEISCLVRQIGIMEPVFACLLHPVQAARIAASWCLRCITISVPSQLTPLIDRCLNRLEHMKNCGDAISGYSFALSALLVNSAGFTVAEDMIRTASQASSLAQVKSQAGWILVAAVLKLGGTTVQDCIGRLLPLWKSSFPRSAKEAEAEKIVAMPLHGCVLLKLVLLCTLMTIIRIRIYQLLSHISPTYYEHTYSSLLRELVADLTLSDNGQSTASTSILSSFCPGVDKSLLGAWLSDTDQAFIELEMHPSQNFACGTIDNDVLCIVKVAIDDALWWPEPLYHTIVVINAAICIYGRIYPFVPPKHQLQMAEHFIKCIKGTKNTVRQQSIQKNVFGCLLASFKAVSEQKVYVWRAGLSKKPTSIYLVILFSVFRCAAVETLGRLAQVVSDAQFVASMAQYSFDRLKSCRDANNRAGYALALGSLHRYVGSLGSGQHLNTSVSILLALAQDATSSLVQSWSLVALSLIADTGGGMFRGYVEPCLSLCLKLLLDTPSANVDVMQCTGKFNSIKSTGGLLNMALISPMVSALINTMGPELQLVGAVEGTRTSFLIASVMMLNNSDSLVQVEAISCLQQLHLFTPRHVHLDRLKLLSSPHLILRKVSVCCLRQLVQREAKEVREHAQTLVPQGIMNNMGRNNERSGLPETGLEGVLLAMLDVETDVKLKRDIKETLISLVQAVSRDFLSYWLSLCKDILASSMGTDVRSAIQLEERSPNGTKDDEDERESIDDDVTLQSATVVNREEKMKVIPRWPSRVFATELVQRIMSVCETERAHFDLALAKELQVSSGGRADYLVLHLSDLVRMSFMGATSDNTSLRLAGLACLQDVITRFSSIPEPEFPGHVILEQFQAQVGAALRPAFTADTPSDVTAAACQVCSTWIGSGVAQDLNDLRRVHQLLVSSLDKLTHGSINTQLYSESAATLEKLAILKAWAEFVLDEEKCNCLQESLLNLVSPELNLLINCWLAVLRDSALLSLPPEFKSQLPPKGGAYYTAECADFCKEHYRISWPPILLAACTWLKQNDFELQQNTSGSEETHFHIMLGICIETLCSNRTYSVEDLTVQIKYRRQRISPLYIHILESPTLVGQQTIRYELILTRENLRTQQLCADVVMTVLDAAEYSITLSDIENDISDQQKNISREGYKGAEGTADGLHLSNSLSFAVLEVALCLLVRQVGLNILIRIPMLCSPDGVIVILPSILFLILGVLRESSLIDKEQLVPDVPFGHVSIAAATAMQALKALLTATPNDFTFSKWVSVMKSTLISLLDMAEDSKIDGAVIMLAIAVFITSSPPQLVTGNVNLLARIYKLFQTYLESEHKQVVVKCMQSLASVFGRREICYPFIAELVPKVLNRIRPFITSISKGIAEIPESDDVIIVQEAVRILEVALSVADQKKKLAIVNLIVQLLGTFLCEDPATYYRRLPVSVRKLHDYALNRLNVIGPSYPEEFKRVLFSFPVLKSKIEGSIRHHTSRTAAVQQTQCATGIGKCEQMSLSVPKSAAIKMTHLPVTDTYAHSSL
ncbi:HTR5B [Dirofilaria immitis]|nr:HTR5B [Dirofilaria immitis]